MFIFGLGYTAKVIASHLESLGWEVVSTGSDGTLSFDDEGSVRLALTDADHVLCSVPPGKESRGEPLDPVLDRYGEALKGKALSYLSSTGVYGDAGGAWVDESSPVGTGRRTARSEADAAWLALGARVYRLPGIYGPGRSMLERVHAGKAHRIDLPGQVFSRVHVEDIAAGVIAGLRGPAGAYNLSDNLPCPQNHVVEEACRLHQKLTLPSRARSLYLSLLMAESTLPLQRSNMRCQPVLLDSTKPQQSLQHSFGVMPR